LQSKNKKINYAIVDKILPLFIMKFSRKFGASYDYFMYFIERFYLKSRRAKLLSSLSGKVLEIGVGTGANFEHYNKDIELTGIEPSPFMLIHASGKRDIMLFPDRITLHNIGCGYPEMENLISPESLDYVVCTLVLCTIPDPVKAIHNFDKWLKPGGGLIILEHIRAHNHIAAKFQDFINPVWEKFAEGCQLNRATDLILKESGLTLVREERFKILIPFYEAQYIKPL